MTQPPPVSPGIQPSWAEYNTNAGMLAVQLRDILAAVVNLDDEMNALPGGAKAGLLAMPDAPSNASALADVLVSSLGNLAAFAGFYTGKTAPQMDYRANSIPLWGVK